LSKQKLFKTSLRIIELINIGGKSIKSKELIQKKKKLSQLEISQTFDLAVVKRPAK